jgi:hypothetical protein
MVCYQCGNNIKLERKLGRQDTCPQCNAYLHCCLNCRFHDDKSPNECREPQAEWVRDKKMGNFCDYFEVKSGQQQVDMNSRNDDARKKLDALFGK